MLRFFRTLYIDTRLWLVLMSFVVGFVAAYGLPILLPLLQLAFVLLLAGLLLDVVLLFGPAKPVFARRDLPDRLSNGDDNPLSIVLENRYPFPATLEVVDEIPVQFQRRDVLFGATLPTNTEQIIRYELRPVRRGEYTFGTVNVFAKTPLGLLKRRFRFGEPVTVAVYPSFLQMRQYELLAISNRLSEVGIKRIRRVGQSREFEQIRPYTEGDDLRTINWKATARRSAGADTGLMTNAYRDERSQAVYCLIDKGRAMRSPFNGLTLLDYAINAALVLGNIALLKQDRAGLITFADRLGQVLPAERRPGQIRAMLETLYRQKTRFLEPDYEALYTGVRTHVRQRSLLLLFTNFDTLNALRRQLPYLRRLAKDHLLLVIFFENTELRALLDTPARNTEEIYQKTIAEKFAFEKKQIVRELQQYGIQALLTTPQNLTANTINRYLDFKARGLL
jgi:uncharacterized protein (DUF58 family)